jgi:hypothetical protein
MSAGIPPAPVITLLRLEGAAVFAAMLFAYQSLGGNWWLFALLALAPDLAMLGYLAGNRAGATAYNLAHTYVAPLLIAALSLVPGLAWVLSLAVIWAAHIGADRALGYGLKYPDGFGMTHLGLTGRARKSSNANAG